MDVLRLAQALFMSVFDPADLSDADVPAVYEWVMGIHHHDHDALLRSVAHQYYDYPRQSSARMASCLMVAFGYLDDDELADQLLAAIFGAGGTGSVGDGAAK